jgi:hypothetical protein
VIQLLEDFGNQRIHAFHPIALGEQDQDRNGKCRQILLKLDISVCRQKDIKLRGSKRRQFRILDAGPTTSRYGCRFSPMRNAPGRRGIDSSSRMRRGQEDGARLFEYSYGQIATDGREVIKKHFQRITRFKMIE